MATKTLKRRLAAITSFIASTFSVAYINLTTVMATPVLVDDGKVKLGTNSGNTAGTVDIVQTSNSIFSNLRLLLNGCMGIVLITLVLAFVIKCAQLASSADNAQKRGGHITGLLWLAVCIGALGAFSTVMSLLVSFAEGI